jgi:hypothetical protein
MQTSLDHCYSLQMDIIFIFIVHGALQESRSNIDPYLDQLSPFIFSF